MRELSIKRRRRNIVQPRPPRKPQQRLVGEIPGVTLPLDSCVERFVVAGLKSWAALLIGDSEKDSTMSILAWIVLGLIAGFIASKIYVGSGQGFLLDIVLGIVGAVVGGYLFTAFGATGVTGFNIWSMLVAVIGAVIVLWLYHALAAR
jgi:uncharacterized membrane protein YeaQ/YmgE (transglycosylase-associated protein family)